MFVNMFVTKGLRLQVRHASSSIAQWPTTEHGEHVTEHGDAHVHEHVDERVDEHGRLHVDEHPINIVVSCYWCYYNCYMLVKHSIKHASL